MKEQLQQRLQQLKTEYESGQKILLELETRQSNLRETLLRISGAIQVLEEALSEAEAPNSSETLPVTEIPATAQSIANSD
ncbi:hypothetical protein [Nostoc parmelioides]|uniref:Uncharacterized protein n=1 Tax=Nostoc parmelioides FACHB-3921 TaxID=2692909 RepID=A0ABR8BCZ9_9NOSO|nr:hypothetical protein [Nostoc parmelioides]MBD2251972.1 hypothetical protein [Nostoc parmelioides FACHB-3921]